MIEQIGWDQYAPMRRGCSIKYQTADKDSVFSKYKRADGSHSRFGNIEKIRTRKDDVFKLIMATNDAKMQTVSIECRIMESTAQFELYDGTKFELLDPTLSPIIDMFNPMQSQIHHPIRTYSKHQLTLKAYPFANYADNALKKAIYEISLYNELRSVSPLVDYFIMSRAKASAIVMVFKNYESSLLEIVRYRQLADYHWSEAELVSLWKMVIASYKHLKNLSICHRDIRLGKLFFASDNKNQPFQFVNLETARKVTKAEANDLLTVVGVSLFAESPMSEKIESGEEVAMYDPLSYDIACLVRILLSLLNLDPLERESLECKNQRLTPVINKLRGESPNFDEIERDLQAILRNLSYDKNGLFKEDKIISDHLAKSELRRINKDKIDEAYFHCLLQLHKKDTFNRLLLEKINENDTNNRKFQNIALLHKVGLYYASIGLDKNEYFEEEFRLLLELARECREEEFYEDHEIYLNQLSQLQEMVPKDNHELSIRHYNEIIHKLAKQEKLDAANQYMSGLLDQSNKFADIHINVQLEVLLTKAQLELLNRKFETAENTIEKISQIVSGNDFDSQYDAKRFQAEVEYLRGQLEVQLMTQQREQVKKKRIAVAQASLAATLNICTNLPESSQNTVKIINTYLIKSDLASIKEDYPECKKSLESADILLTEVEKGRSVSDVLKRKLLVRLKGVYEKSNKANEPFYKQILSRLGKIDRRFEQSNASRHQRSKQIKSRSKMRSKQEKMVTEAHAIAELNEEDES